MGVPFLSDLKRVPVIYADEAKKFNELMLKNTAQTTTGNASFTSVSSGILYPATTGGEQQLIQLLLANIGNSVLSAEVWNTIPMQMRKIRMGVRI